jgi:hypothetical protein
MGKFQENLKIIKTYIQEKIISRFKIKIAPDQLIVYAVLTGISILIIVNIYGSIGDIQNFKILENEQLVYEELSKENEKLKKDRDYYKSSYFRQLYARESLSLGKESQEFFLVDRGVEVDYTKDEVNPDPIQKQNFRFWWKKLIL